MFPVVIAALWIGNNVRMLKNENRELTWRGVLLGPAWVFFA